MTPPAALARLLLVSAAALALGGCALVPARPGSSGSVTSPSPTPTLRVPAEPTRPGFGHASDQIPRCDDLPEVLDRLIRFFPRGDRKKEEEEA